MRPLFLLLTPLYHTVSITNPNQNLSLQHTKMSCTNSSEEKKAEETGVAGRLARKNILSLTPYRCARDDYSTGILLDANENAIGPTSLPTNSLDPYDNHLSLERYPCPYQTPLKELYASLRGHGLRPSQLFCGVGSDEAIDLLIRIFCVPGVDNIVTTPPTYGMYKVCAAVNDVAVLHAPLTPDFDIVVEDMISTANSNTKLMFVCSPGNPTAKSIPLRDIEALADSSYSGIIVVDEAYVDFSTESAVQLINKYPNIVVLQTLSKAFGLAGIRLGFAIGADDVIQLMNNVKAPYNVNKLTSEVAINALKNIDVLNQNIKVILDQRDVVKESLEGLQFVTKVYPSDANFLLFRVEKYAYEMYKLMANNGVITRYRGSEPNCAECLRVTIGTKEENEAFLKELQNAWVQLNK